MSPAWSRSSACRPIADRRLPDADRRQRRQHSRRREGRPEDRGEVARRARLARRRDRRGAGHQGRGRREPAQGARLAAAGAPPGHRRDRLRPERPRARLAGVRRAGAARDRHRSAARVLRALRLQDAAPRARAQPGAGRRRPGGIACRRPGRCRRRCRSAGRARHHALRDGAERRRARALGREGRGRAAGRDRHRDRFARRDARAN